MTCRIVFKYFVKLPLDGDVMKLNANDYSKGEIMKILRQWTNMTQKDFAHFMGKSKRTIEQYEAGTVNYNIEFLKKLSDKCQIEITFSKKK